MFVQGERGPFTRPWQSPVPKLEAARHNHLFKGTIRVIVNVKLPSLPR